MQAGDTFRLQGVADKHTWVIVSDPDQNPAQVYCVAFTSYDITKDQTCIVQVQEFSILTNISCIDYLDVKIASIMALENGVKQNLIQKRTPVPPELLQKIRDGFNTTRDTKFEYIEFLINQGVI
jgi:hypothetical protein